MSVTWPNVSNIIPSFTRNPQANAKTAYNTVPAFRQTAGVLPGQAPVVGHTVAPAAPIIPMKQRLNMFAGSLSSFITMSH